MGHLLGLPEWLVIPLWAIFVLVSLVTIGLVSIRRAHRELAARRPNPAHDEFMALMADDVDRDIAEWVWNQALPYYRPHSPHPDDHLIKDARIDDDDITMDWFPDFAKQEGLDWKRWPAWPNEQELTVRNFARYLQLGRDALRA